MKEEINLLLLATKGDNYYIARGEEVPNVQLLNQWVDKYYPNGSAHFTHSNTPGVYDASIKNVDVDELVNKFREIPWFEPEITQLMVIRDPAQRLPTTYNVIP